jgi:hypothetical protein
MKIRLPDEIHERICYQLATQYSDPLKALREYVTNSVDAIDDLNDNSHNGLVKILLVPEEKRIVIEDNAAGMNWKKLESVPENIGNSDKYEKGDLRGEKAVGILAFGSIGEYVHIISKQENEGKFNYIRLEKKKNRVSAHPEEGPELLTSRELKEGFFGSFEHGTKVVIDSNPYLLKHDLSSDIVENFIHEAYLPLLMKNKIMFKIVGKQGGIMRKIKAPSMDDGITLINENLSFEVKKSRQTENYEVGTYLVFHPERDGGKVGVYSKDVQVYDSVLSLEKRLSKFELWNCGQISGFINEPNLEITLGRDKINKNTMAYQGLIEFLEGIHEKYWPQIRVTVEKSKKEASNKFAKEAWDLLQKAYQLSDPLNKGVRLPTGGGGGSGGGGGGKGGKKRTRKLPFGTPRILDFGTGEEHLRARKGYSIDPIVEVNSLHRDFEENVIKAKRPKQALDYLLEVTTPFISLFEIEDAEEKGRRFGDRDRVIAEMIRRFQDLKYAAMRAKR